MRLFIIWLLLLDYSLSVAIGHNLSIQEPKPLVKGCCLEDYVNKQDLENGAKALYRVASDSKNSLATRVIGSEGHLKTMTYILESLGQYRDYFDISVQEFNASYSKLHDYHLSVSNFTLQNVSAFTFSPNVTRKYTKVVPIQQSGCIQSNYPPEVNGSIALVKRGFCSFAAKSKLAKSMGAIATIIYNSEDKPLHGTLGEQAVLSDVSPTFGLSESEGERLLTYLKQHPNSGAVVALNGTINKVPTQNIIAETKGGDKRNVVMLGSHSDSVPAGPGINDNGSGSITLLSLAKYLSKFQVKNAVRFAWFSAEEEGLIGSDYYAKTLTPEENLDIRLFLDYDMLASPNYAYQIYDSDDALNPIGSSKIRDTYINFFRKRNQNYTLIPFDGRSDYVGFIKNGIPGGGVSTGAEGIKTKEKQMMFGGSEGIAYDVCYHKECDDLSNLNYDAWIFNSQLIAYTLGNYAASLDDFPKRRVSIDIANVADSFKYHGDRLII